MPEEKTSDEPRDDRDCLHCRWWYPGAGCLSEAFRACGCCPSEISVIDRMKQLTKTMSDIMNLMDVLQNDVKENVDHLDFIRERMGYTFIAPHIDDENNDDVDVKMPWEDDEEEHDDDE